jgi:hypothetical protein
LRLGPGAVLELDRKVGEAIDIYVNNRLVARGEVVLVEEKLGVTMTEMITGSRGESVSNAHPSMQEREIWSTCPVSAIFDSLRSKNRRLW